MKNEKASTSFLRTFDYGRVHSDTLFLLGQDPSSSQVLFSSFKLTWSSLLIEVDLHYIALFRFQRS